ncbi:hypothetical protein [Pseudomonas aeruginosa]|nr:hypothetical protein [Pseudomonas aeruginosa]HCF2765488.1 hypothetical protein [Pseudomonas aeruginosa]HCF6944937.1 hypothetical protein [Pseudomonas aeruginosa]
MTKQEIIAAITRLAHDAAIAPAERQKQLEDIEFAAQDQREKLEERYSDD